jgi:hypothetical protein
MRTTNLVNLPAEASVSSTVSGMLSVLHILTRSSRAIVYNGCAIFAKTRQTKLSRRVESEPALKRKSDQIRAFVVM